MDSGIKKIFFVSLFLLFPFSRAFAIFQRIDGIEDVYIKRVAISPFNRGLIYVGSRNSLFISYDSGKTFKKLYVFKDEEITHLFFDPYLANTAYISTTRHLYKITDRVQKLFTSPEEAVIYTAAKYKGKIYIGTSIGLYFANEDILNWQTDKGLGAVPIYSIETDKKKIYLAAGNGVYVKDKDSFRRIFVFREKEEIAEESSGVNINIIKLDLFSEKTIWLGTNRGLYFSIDNGITWDKLYIGGLDNISINSICQTKEEGVLYLGTEKGFFRVDIEEKTSTSLDEGIYGNKIFWIDTIDNEIYLATSKGLFKNTNTPTSSSRDIEDILKDEPSIEEVQEVALRYNEVHPDKIKRWRNRLKLRALFPTIKWDYDKTVDIYQTTTTTKIATGPRDWGLSFSWDMGDFIWNSYEDDVDTRSRLNTQLRIDILDEINRVYFERLRLKQELLNSSLSQEKLFQKKLRLKELTAILDGLTGGYFSFKKKSDE